MLSKEKLIECARCGKFFQSSRTEEESTKEFVENFGEIIGKNGRNCINNKPTNN